MPPAAALLAWYDRHRRTLPWRATPGERADPYRVWLSEIMLQQTTVRAVAPYYARFLARWPNVRALAAAPLDDVLKAWAGLGYYARARNLHACARAVVERHGGSVSGDEAALRALPGIGDYTAAAIAAIAFDCQRARSTAISSAWWRGCLPWTNRCPAPSRGCASLRAALTPQRRPGDFAQAMMDLGASLCSPKKPACALCPWNESCAGSRAATPRHFPRRMPKREGALRRGAAFVVRRADGYVLLRTRAAKGLLGGMTEVPTTSWSADFAESEALNFTPIFSSLSAPRKGETRWRRSPGVVRHVFTHFPLELSVYARRSASTRRRRTARAGRRFQSLPAKRCRA